MWTVIHIANTLQDAKHVEKILVEEGFLVKIKPIGRKNIEGTCEILVPRGEAEEVHLILFDLGLGF